VIIIDEQTCNTTERKRQIEFYLISVINYPDMIAIYNLLPVEAVLRMIIFFILAHQ